MSPSATVPANATTILAGTGAGPARADRGLDQAVGRAMREAAQRAIMPRFGTSLASAYKQPGEVVTAADRESEAILAERLASLIPGAAIVGEEAADDDPALLDSLTSGTCWIIDPLDGTANFAAGTGPFGILVALAQDGVPVGGWILDPLSGRFCAAQAGRGATVDGAPFQVSLATRTRPLVAVTRLFADPLRREAVLTALATTFDVLDSPRCAADQYPRVASGENDATLFTRTIAWDHAAGAIFVNEAGGRAARPDGSPFHCDDAQGGMIVAASPAVWESLARDLQFAGIALSGAAV